MDKLARIQELEGNLEKYKGKYRAAREAKRELRRVCNFFSFW
jgi:hypothetical protein